jgi:hypothetical protein
VELTRLAIVYAHLISCCLALGSVLTADACSARALFLGSAPYESHKMRSLGATVVWSLAFLWASGLALVAIDAHAQGFVYFQNPKLQAKLIVVLSLSANGMAIHQLALPWLEKSLSLLTLSWPRRSAALLLGSVSAVSWCYAALLGVGRPLAWKYSLAELLASWPILIGACWLSMMALCSLARRRHKKRAELSIPEPMIAPLSPGKAMRRPVIALDLAEPLRARLASLIEALALADRSSLRAWLALSSRTDFSVAGPKITILISELNGSTTLVDLGSALAHCASRQRAEKLSGSFIQDKADMAKMSQSPKRNELRLPPAPPPRKSSAMDADPKR